MRISSRQIASALLGITLILALPVLAGAQTSAVLPRVTSRVDNTALTALHGNVHPLARAQYDQGAVADSLPMHRMLLLLQRSPAQESALKQLMDDQQSSASANYHKWLTPQQFGQQFGPADADVQSVTDWLTSQGFQVAKVSSGKTVIEFSGTAGQVRNAFHTEIHRYVVNGEQHFANNSDPEIPTALAPVVAGPVSLHNFPKHALVKKLGAFRKNVATGKVDPLYTFSTNYCGNNPCNALGPGDFDTIYNVEKLWSPGIGGHPIDGTGQTIAIVGDSEICTANSPDFGTTYIGPYGTNSTCASDDVATFRSLFGLPANPPKVIVDGPDPGFNPDETEGDLDVEWSGAVAKGATIDFVIAEDTEATYGTDLAAEYIVDNNLAPVLSESYGECEQYLGSDGNAFESTLWEQAAAQGITVVVSAGDSGAASCDDGYNVAEVGLAVNGIASTPFNVAAGGTDFDITLPAVSTYQTTYWGTNLTVNGIPETSAKFYIPETTWNDSCAQNLTTGSISGSGGCTAQNYSGGGTVAGGGGQSNCVAPYEQYSCYYVYEKPSWQTLPENGAGLTGLTGANPDFTRDLPDISLFAADGYVSNSFYVVCESDYNSPPAACDLTQNNFFDFIGVGGTSSSAPTFAGMMALVNQEMTIQNGNGTNPQYPTSQGNANYVLYHLFSNQSALACNSSTSPNSSCTFNDITRGNNSVPCTPYYYEGTDETFGCSTTVSGAYGVLEDQNLDNGGPVNGLYGFDAAAGPDLATGLGSVNALNLVSNWPGVVGSFTPTATTLCLSTLATTTATSCSVPSSAPITITHGTPVYVNIAVTPAAGGSPISALNSNYSSTPSTTEDVALIGTFTSGNPCTIPGCSTGAVDHFTSNGGAPQGNNGPDYLISNADIYPLTGGVFTSATASTTANQNYTIFLTGGSYNVVARYGGDGTYGSSSSTTPMYVTVNPEGSTSKTCVFVYDPVSGNTTGEVLLAPLSSPAYECEPATTATYGQYATIRADVIGNTSLQESATGSLTLTDNGGSIVGPTGTATGLYTLNSEGYLEDQTPFLAVGSHSFAATYHGDASYLATAISTSVPLMVNQGPTSTTVSSSANTIAPGQSVTLTASIATDSVGSLPTGSVQFLVGSSNFGSSVAITSSINSVTGLDQAVALLPTTTLPSGSDVITAKYFGDTNYASSTSTQSTTVTVGSPGINSPAPGCSNSTITISSPGGSGNCLITVNGVNSFAGTVSLGFSVTNEPSGAVDPPTCSFSTPATNFTSPITITLSTASEAGSATLTCSTTAASLVTFRPSNHPFGRAWPLAGVLVSLVCLFFLLAVPRQGRWKLVSLAVLFVVVAAAGVSCGGGSGSAGGGGGGGNPGTTTGPYTISVTATPQGGTTLATPITVNVE